MRVAKDRVAEEKLSGTAAERAGGCDGGRGGNPGRWRTGLICMGIALAAAGAYGLGWISETPLVLSLAAVALYARAKFGWFG